MKIYLRAVLMVALLFISSLPSFAATRIEVQGHRGARGARPENTLPAFEYALQNGIDTLELDIAVSQDSELVISHDPALTPDRCLGPSGQALSKDIEIHSLSYIEIAKYDCGSVKNPRFPQQVLVPHTPKPRLEDLFIMIENSKLAGAKNIQFNIETKSYPSHPELTPEPKKFAQMIINLGMKHHMISRMILQSFDDRTLLAAKKIEPKLRTSLLTSDNHIDYVAVMLAAHADILSPNHEWILAGDVEALHKIHVKVLPWTVNEAKDWDRMISFGVDGIISDYPKELSDHLKSKKMR